MQAISGGLLQWPLSPGWCWIELQQEEIRAWEKAGVAKPVVNLKPALGVVFKHDFVSGNGVCENLRLHLWPCRFICGLGFDLLPAAAVKIGNFAGGPPPPPHPSWPQPRDELTCPAWDSQFLASFFPWITNSFKFPKYFFFLPSESKGTKKERKILLWNNGERHFVILFWRSGAYSSNFLDPRGSPTYLWLSINLELFNHKHLNFSRSLFCFHQMSLWEAKYVSICSRIHLLSPVCLLGIIPWLEKNTWVPLKPPVSRKCWFLVFPAIKNCIKEAALISWGTGF